MAIKTTETEGKLTLEIDNGDLEKMKQCMAGWSFKDHQSLIRFVTSILLLSEDKSLWIRSEGRPQLIAPAKEFLKEQTGE